MLPFRKILFPVDYSPSCSAIVPYVKEMVRHFAGQLTLVHAYGPEALAYSDLPINDPELPEEARSHEEQRLREFAQETFPGQHVESFTELGDAGAAVHKVVQHQGADLVMLATHGRGPVRRLLLGSVTARVLHDLSTAVWTGVGSYLTEHAPRIPYKSVLCALDDSEEAQAVLRASAEFASTHCAQLWLVHAVETPPATLEIDLSPYKKDVMDAADFRLRELKAAVGLSVPHVVIDAALADGVRQQVVLRKADLIITGRGHAQATFSRLWSRLYPIVRESPCPFEQFRAG